MRKRPVGFTGINQEPLIKMIQQCEKREIKIEKKD